MKAARYVVAFVVVLAAWFVMWQSDDDVFWALWLVPLLFPLGLYVLEYMYYRCPRCGRADALEFREKPETQRARKLKLWTFRCRECGHVVDRIPGYRG